jgi:hypothetical protein
VKEADGEQDGLLVLRLHEVHQLGDLPAVTHQLGRVARVRRLPDLIRDEIRQQHRDHREGYADEQIELAPEGPTVCEAPYGHQASFVGCCHGTRSDTRDCF